MKSGVGSLSANSVAVGSVAAGASWVLRHDPEATIRYGLTGSAVAVLAPLVVKLKKRRQRA